MNNYPSRVCSCSQKDCDNRRVVTQVTTLKVGMGYLFFRLKISKQNQNFSKTSTPLLTNYKKAKPTDQVKNKDWFTSFRTVRQDEFSGFLPLSLVLVGARCQESPCPRTPSRWRSPVLKVHQDFSCDHSKESITEVTTDDTQISNKKRSC